jgi:hypothetical protein
MSVLNVTVPVQGPLTLHKALPEDQPLQDLLTNSLSPRLPVKPDL